MEQSASQTPPPSREEWRQRRAEAIEKFIREFAPSDDDDLLGEMLLTVCRLSADQTDRGDLKILNAALRELRYAFKVFRPYADTPKVTMFGSARTKENHPQYRQARQFAELIQQRGWMVITGAGDGIMRAGHHGATRQKSFGVAISLPFEQRTNPIIENDPKLVHFKYFFTRKLIFVKEAQAIALFPGGFGTQDEGFEALTLVQTSKTVPLPIVLVDEPGGTYWTHWRTYVEKELLGHGMVDPDDVCLFRITDSAEEAVEEAVNFYRRYHSSRFVGDQLVLRLKTPLSGGVLDQINSLFTDILSGGRFEQVPCALEEEQGEFNDLPRLVFTFNRRSSGRLRRLIDLINAA